MAVDPALPTALLDGVVDDLTSRGALAGALAGIYALGTIGWWVLYVRGVHRRTARIPVRILVAGTRGKSSTVRLLHAALSHAGWTVAGKTTGTAARYLEPDGRERATLRLGQVSIMEMVSFMSHAARRDVDAVVAECMAVKPDLIRQLSADMVRPTIVTVTNCDIDHVEEEGSNRLEIMRSLAQSVTGQQIVVTGEHDPWCVWELQQRVQAMHGLIVAVDARMSRNTTGEALVPGVHPDDVAMVLATTRSCGIADDVAIAGLRVATREPEAEELIDGVLAGVSVRFCNLGSINDANNVLPAVRRLLGPRTPGEPRIALLSGRSDRPLRALLFAGLMSPEDFDGVVVTGGPESMVVDALLSSGWSERRILRLGGLAYSRRLSTRAIVRLVRGLDEASERFELVALENIHVPFTVALRNSLVRATRRRS